MKFRRLEVNRFRQEFGGQSQKPRFRSLFSRELAVEPQMKELLVAKISSSHDVRNLTGMLRNVGYSLRPLTVWSRGEDIRAVKDYGEPVAGVFGGRRRHLKIWVLPPVKEHDSGLIAITVHEELAPLNILGAKLGRTLESHLQTGQGDYEAGTESFMIELRGYARAFAPWLDE